MAADLRQMPNWVVPAAVGARDGDFDGALGMYSAVAVCENEAERRRQREERLRLSEDERVRLGYHRCGCERYRPHADGCPVGIEIDSLIGMVDGGLISSEELGDRLEALQAEG